jgi:hypothetical protein
VASGYKNLVIVTRVYLSKLIGGGCLRRELAVRYSVISALESDRRANERNKLADIIAKTLERKPYRKVKADQESHHEKSPGAWMPQIVIHGSEKKGCHPTLDQYDGRRR